MAWIKDSANCSGYDRDGVYFCGTGKMVLEPVNWDEMGFQFEWETYQSNQPQVITFDDKYIEKAKTFLELVVPNALFAMEGDPN